MDMDDDDDADDADNTQVYTEMLCRGSVYVSSFSAVELVDQLRAELRQNANSAINHLTGLHLLLHTGPTDRYVLPTAVTLVARSLSLSLSLSLRLRLRLDGCSSAYQKSLRS